MSRQLITLFFLLALVTSSTANNAPKKCYRNTKTIVRSYSVGKMTDHYFKLKKRNYFQYYQRVLGLTKIAVFKGHYTQSNDTLYLTFCGGTPPPDLIGTAIIDEKKKEIIVHLKNSKVHEQFSIDVDKRRKIQPKPNR